MELKKSIICGLTATVLFLTSCGQDLPFEYKYLSANMVRIDYQGKSYTLNRFGPRSHTPFQYAFEPDGDLDITIAGKTWDIDSPYDIDSSKKKTKKKKTKKGKKK